MRPPTGTHTVRKRGERVERFWAGKAGRECGIRRASGQSLLDAGGQEVAEGHLLGSHWTCQACGEARWLQDGAEGTRVM